MMLGFCMALAVDEGAGEYIMFLLIAESGLRTEERRRIIGLPVFSESSYRPSIAMVDVGWRMVIHRLENWRVLSSCLAPSDLVVIDKIRR